MSVNLSGYRAIQAAMFVRLDIEGYDVLRFSDLGRNYTLDGEEYTNLGSLLSVTGSVSEVRATESEFSIAISGIPTNAVAEILNNNPKGSGIVVKRGFFNPLTGALLSVDGNPAIKFDGIVTNYSMDEEWDFAAQTASHTIVLICSNTVGILRNKVAGRRTNPYDQERFFPGDKSMTRVPTVANSNFQFGAPPGTV
jgi:hypothetical protein